jgi:hypothetical protein
VALVVEGDAVPLRAPTMRVGSVLRELQVRNLVRTDVCVCRC